MQTENLHRNFHTRILIMKRSIVLGIMATCILLLVYISVVTLISGWTFAVEQFFRFWYFVISLAIGFGIQVGLFTYLKNAIKHAASPRMLAVSGTTSTAAMVSCCAHYLANLLPVLGTVGIFTVISQYQVQLFWVGLMFNGAGILYILNRIIKFSKMQ